MLSSTEYVLNKIPLAEVVVIRGGMRNVYLDSYYPVSEDECVYTFALKSRAMRGSVQCNANRLVVERLVKGRLEYPDFKEIRLIPMTNWPLFLGDYA